MFVHLAYDDTQYTPSSGEVWISDADNSGLVKPVSQGSIGGGGGAGELDDLSDVTITTPATGDLIRYNGSQFVNYPDSNYADASHNHAASDITSGTFADARISDTSVQQHIDKTYVDSLNIDADTVDGQHASAFAAASHTHDDRYYTETETDNLLDNKVDTSDVGSANGVASLDGSGKVPSAQLPALALTEVHVVADITARDALTVQEGDVAIVQDAGSGEPATYIYDGTNWQEMESPTDGVTSVTAAGPLSSSGGTTPEISLTGQVPVANGGTGASTASGARTNLGLVIGTDVQAWSSVLDATTAPFTTTLDTKLDGIEDGAEVNNISDANATDLTDGGDTTLHTHDIYLTQAEGDARYVLSSTNEETVEDIVGGMLTGNTETRITVTYQDADGTIDFVVDDNLANYDNSSTNFQTLANVQSEIDSRVDKAFVDALNVDADTLDGQDSTAFATSGHNHSGTYAPVSHTHTSTDITDFAEAVSDQVGTMVAGNTETLITVTYDDTDNTLDFVVNNDLSAYSNATSNFQNPAGVNSLIDTRVDKAFVDALNVDADTLDGNDSTAFATAGHSHTTDLDDLNDVTVTTVADNEVLAYDSTSGDWINQTAAEAGLATSGHNHSGVYAPASHTHSASDVTSGTFADARISASSVEQHVDKAYVDGLGVDADTVDGQHASAFASASHNHTSSDITDFAEAVSDQVGTMVTGNTETGITVTYQDADNTLDFVIAYGTPVALVPDNATSAGSGNTAARANHVHGIATDPAVGISNSSTNTEGTASSFARSDHTHAVSGFALTSHTHSGYVDKTGDTMTGDLEFTDIGEGIILKSPNGTRFRVTIDNTGNLTTTAL